MEIKSAGIPKTTAKSNKESQVMCTNWDGKIVIIDIRVKSILLKLFKTKTTLGKIKNINPLVFRC